MSKKINVEDKLLIDQLLTFYEKHRKIIKIDESYYRDYHYFKKNNIDLNETYFVDKKNLEYIISEEKYSRNKDFEWIINGIISSLNKLKNGSKFESKYLQEKLFKSLNYLNDENLNKLLLLLLKWKFK